MKYRLPVRIESDGSLVVPYGGVPGGLWRENGEWLNAKLRDQVRDLHQRSSLDEATAHKILWLEFESDPPLPAPEQTSETVVVEEECER